jgi:hypothetical protein
VWTEYTLYRAALTYYKVLLSLPHFYWCFSYFFILVDIWSIARKRRRC